MNWLERGLLPYSHDGEGYGYLGILDSYHTLEVLQLLKFLFLSVLVPRYQLLKRYLL